MASPEMLTLFCNPQCGHARAIIARLRACGLAYEQRDLRDPEFAMEVVRRYRIQESPVLVIGTDIAVGTVQILEKIETIDRSP
jgi:glutaredoxin